MSIEKAVQTSKVTESVGLSKLWNSFVVLPVTMNFLSSKTGYVGNIETFLKVNKTGLFSWKKKYTYVFQKSVILSVVFCLFV